MKKAILINVCFLLATLALIGLWLSQWPMHACVWLGKSIDESKELIPAVMGILIGAVIAWWAGWAVALGFAKQATQELIDARNKLNNALDESAGRVIEKLTSAVAKVPGATLTTLETNALISAICLALPHLDSVVDHIKKQLPATPKPAGNPVPTKADASGAPQTHLPPTGVK